MLIIYYMKTNVCVSITFSCYRILVGRILLLLLLVSTTTSCWKEWHQPPHQARRVNLSGVVEI
jgi:hypothetical protein